MKVQVDRSRCTKAGECYYNHPALFRVGDDQYPVVIVDEVPPELEWEAHGAAEVCPVQAITVIEDEPAR